MVRPVHAARRVLARQGDGRELTTRVHEAEAHVANFGTSDDFEVELGSLLETAFRARDDGGAIEPLESGLVRVAVAGRLRDTLGRPTIERATFARGIAVARQDEDENAPEFLSPGHPLVEAALRQLRDEAADPIFVHRFDVEVGSPESRLQLPAALC